MTASATPPPGAGPEPTLGALVHDLSTQIPELVRSELRLAQAEMTEKGKRAGLGLGMFSGAGLLAFLGLATLIATAILALALVPATPGSAALVVAAALLLGAGLLALLGKNQVVEATPPKPERAVDGIKEDIATVKGQHTVNGKTPEQMEADITAQREQLADTVDQLTAKLDVKAHAQARATDMKHRATTESGRPAPQLVAAIGAVVAGAAARLVAPPRMRRLKSSTDQEEP